MTIHQKNVQLLMTEIFKTINYLSPSFMEDCFLLGRVTYDLRHANTFLIFMVHTVNYGTKAFRYCDNGLSSSSSPGAICSQLVGCHGSPSPSVLCHPDTLAVRHSYPFCDVVCPCELLFTSTSFPINLSIW